MSERSADRADSSQFPGKVRLSTGSIYSNGETDTFKKLRPGIQRIIQDESKQTLQAIREELKEFVLFVDEVQKKVPTEMKISSDKPTDENHGIPPNSNLLAPDVRPTNAPLRDAFKIVRNLFSKISELIHSVAYDADVSDDPHKETSPYHDFYYAQYVFQIAFFVFQIVGQQTAAFSRTLQELAEDSTIDKMPSAEDDVEADARPPHEFMHKTVSPNREGKKPDDYPFTPRNSSEILSVLSNKRPLDSDLRKRIEDALELLVFLSEKMISWIQECGTSQFSTSNSCKINCQEKSDRTSIKEHKFLERRKRHPSLIAHTSCPSHFKMETKTQKDSDKINNTAEWNDGMPTKKCATKNRLLLQDKNEHRAQCRLDEGDSESSDNDDAVDVKLKVDNDGHIEVLHYNLSQLGKSSPRLRQILLDKRSSHSDLLSAFGLRLSNELNFRKDIFALHLREGFRKMLAQESADEPLDSAAIINFIIDCFREATDDQCRENGGHGWCSSSESSSETTEEEHTCSRGTGTPGFSPEYEKHLDEVLEKFVTDTYKRAVMRTKKERKDAETVAPSKKDTNAELPNFVPVILTTEFKERLMGGYHLKEACSCGLHFFISDFKNDVLPELSPLNSSMDPEPKFCTRECYEGPVLHPLHDKLPLGVMEVRTVQTGGKVVITLEEWQEEECDPRGYPLKALTSSRAVTVGKSTETTEDQNELEEPIANEREHLSRWRGAKNSFGESKVSNVQLPTNACALEVCKQVKKRSSESIVSKTLDTDVKSAALYTKEYEARRKKRTAGKRHSCIDEEEINRKLHNFFEDAKKIGNFEGPPLLLKLRRNNFFEDSYTALMSPSRIPLHYYRCLRVIFLREPKGPDTFGQEEALDEDDEIDELFCLLSREFFDPGKILFGYPTKESSFMYPKPAKPDDMKYFRFFGVILALSILYQEPLRVALPECFYKCILNRPLVPSDLQEIDPLMYERLSWMQSTDISGKKQNYKFVIKRGPGTQARSEELIPGGAETVVTENNKCLYMERCAKYRLEESCLSQLQEIKRGLASVIDPHFMTPFTEDELQYIVKNPTLDAWKCLDEDAEEVREMEFERRVTI